MKQADQLNYLLEDIIAFKAKIDGVLKSNKGKREIAVMNALKKEVMKEHIEPFFRVGGFDDLRKSVQDKIFEGKFEEASDILIDAYITQALLKIEGKELQKIPDSDSLLKKNNIADANAKAYNSSHAQIKEELSELRNDLKTLHEKEPSKNAFQKLADLLQSVFNKLNIKIQVANKTKQQVLTDSLKQMAKKAVAETTALSGASIAEISEEEKAFIRSKQEHALTDIKGTSAEWRVRVGKGSNDPHGKNM